MKAADNILARVRTATRIKSHLPDEKPDAQQIVIEGVNAAMPKDIVGLWQQFKTELEKVSGEFYEVKDKGELADLLAYLIEKSNFNSLALDGNNDALEVASRAAANLAALEIIDVTTLTASERSERLSNANLALLSAPYAIAEIGSIVLFPNEMTSVLAHLLPECVMIFIRQDQMLASLGELFQRVPVEQAKSMLLVTGPSRTADIEKILILGAHGPKRLIVTMYKK